MNVVVMIGNKARSLNIIELRTLIMSKVIRRTVNIKYADYCAAFILNHNGSTTGGGCPTKIKFQGRRVFHISHGKKGKHDGCAVFFSNSSDSLGNAVIVAVGYHDKDVKNMPHYSLDWTKRNFTYGQGSIQF